MITSLHATPFGTGPARWALAAPTQLLPTSHHALPAPDPLAKLQTHWISPHPLQHQVTSQSRAVHEPPPLQECPLSPRRAPLTCLLPITLAQGGPPDPPGGLGSPVWSQSCAFPSLSGGTAAPTDDEGGASGLTLVEYLSLPLE